MTLRSPGRGASAVGDPSPSRDLRKLRHVVRFFKPYKLAIAGAILALATAAATVLALGFGLRRLVDEGFRGDDTVLLDQALVVMLGVIIVLAAASYGRYFLVSWVGERVVADLRRAVYDHVIGLSQTFFETTRTGEILSRLTADTTVLQVVLGATASMALRNVLLLVGGTILLAVTSPKLSGLVVVIVPVVVLPIVVFGRRVRRLSRLSQDRVADASAHIDETLHAVQTVQAFGRETLERQRFGARIEEAFTTAIRRVRARTSRGSASRSSTPSSVIEPLSGS